jgi:hypothetical protein
MTGTLGARQGASEVVRQLPSSADNAGPGVVLPSPAAPASHVSKGMCVRRVRDDRSWRRAVKRVPSRDRIAARRFGAARKNLISVREASSGRPQRKLASPEIERSMGARIMRRLQRSVRRDLVRCAEGSR